MLLLGLLIVSIPCATLLILAYRHDQGHLPGVPPKAEQTTSENEFRHRVAEVADAAKEGETRDGIVMLAITLANLRAEGLDDIAIFDGWRAMRPDKGIDIAWWKILHSRRLQSLYWRDIDVVEARVGKPKLKMVRDVLLEVEAAKDPIQLLQDPEAREAAGKKPVKFGRNYGKWGTHPDDLKVMKDGSETVLIWTSPKGTKFFARSDAWFAEQRQKNK